MKYLERMTDDIRTSCRLPASCGILAAAGLLAVLIYTAYSNTFQSPPVLDDFHSFVRNATIYVNHWSYKTVVDLSRTFFGRARWIPMLTFALDYSIGGGRFVQFHLTNLIIHLLVTGAVFFLALQCCRLRRDRAGKEGLFGVYPALWVAALWALNPVQTNAVTYMVQRMASIEALFFVTSVAFYIRGRRLQQAGWAGGFKLWFNYLACAAAAVGAFFSKENSAMLPVVLVVAEVWLFRPDAPRQSWHYLRKQRRWVHFLVALVVVLGIAAAAGQLQRCLHGYSIRHFTMPQRLLTETRIIVWYISLLLLPLPSRLSLEHDVVLSTSLVSPLTTLFAICFLTVSVFLIVRQRRRYPLVTFGAAWFFLNLAIESSVVPLELVFEHRLYLPSVGFFLALVFGYVRLAEVMRKRFGGREWTKVSWSVVALLCAVLTLMTFQRNKAWRDILSINADAVHKAPRLSRSHVNYSSALLRAHRYDEAIKEAEKAMALGKPNLEDYVVAANNIVSAHMQQGQWREAAQIGEKFLKERPQDSDAMDLPQLRLSVAESHRREGELEAAYKNTMRAFEVMNQLPFSFRSVRRFAVIEQRQILQEAADRKLDLDRDGKLDPGGLPIDLWLARRFLEKRDYTDARGLLTALLQKDPGNNQARQCLASLDREMARNRKQEERWDFFDKYVKRPLKPFNACMAVAYLVRKYRLGYPLKIVGLWFLKRAERLRADDPDVYLLRGWYCFEDGLVDDALRLVNRAIELDPGYAKAWMAKGFFMAGDGRKGEAVRAFEKALELYPGYPKRRVIGSLISQFEREGGHRPEAAKTVGLETGRPLRSVAGPGTAAKGKSLPARRET